MYLLLIPCEFLTLGFVVGDVTKAPDIVTVSAEKETQVTRNQRKYLTMENSIKMSGSFI